METKICTKCKIEREIIEFNKNKKDRHGCWCKICFIKYRKDHKEKKIKYDKTYRETNKRKIKEKKKKYYLENSEKINEQRRIWKKNNKWVLYLVYARTRCNNPKTRKYKHYGGKGIKCLLTTKEIKYLWDKFDAKNMIKPSLHRKDSDKNYTVDNCEFLEWKEHFKIHLIEQRKKNEQS